MNRHLANVVARLDAALASLDEPLDHVIPKAIASEQSLSPWALWLLICLARHRERQQWVANLVKHRLAGEPEAIAQRGAFGHPDRPQSGLVPGDTDWEYYFHGCGCCVTNRLTGESIDVDFFDDTPDWIDLYFFINYLKSLKRPAFAEKRLIELHPSYDAIVFALEELAEAGLVEFQLERKAAFRLTNDTHELDTGISLFGEELGEQKQLVIGAWLGDWSRLALSELIDDGVVSEAAVRCQKQREELLLQRLQDTDKSRNALAGLADLGSPHLREYLIRALGQVPSGTTSVALEIIHGQADQDYTESVYLLFRQLSPRDSIPSPHLWKTSAEYLLKRGHRADEVSRSLLQIGEREVGDVAVLALQFAPEHARGLFRRALRSTIPCDRNTAAAALAILDEDWCHDELVAALNDSDDQEATSEIRAALLASSRHQVHEAVRDWEQRHPRAAESGPFISMTEMTLRRAGEWLQYDMEKLHDRVLPCRGIVPLNEPPRAEMPPPKAQTPRKWWWPFG